MEPTQQKGTWIGLTRGAQWAWIRKSAKRWKLEIPSHPSGTVLVLEGKHITRLPAVFCAFGEMVAGPGGYFGRGFDSLNDCLRGGMGVEPPWTLRWRDVHVARDALGHAEVEQEQRRVLKYYRGFWYRNDPEAYKDIAHQRALIARAARGEGPTFFEEILEILRDNRVTVEFE